MYQGLLLTFCVSVLSFSSPSPSIPCHAHIRSDTCEHRRRHMYNVYGSSTAVMGQIGLKMEDVFICLRCTLALAPRSTTYIALDKPTCTLGWKPHTHKCTLYALTYGCLDYFLGLIKCAHYLDSERRCNHTRLCEPVPNQSLIDDY